MGVRVFRFRHLSLRLLAILLGLLFAVLAATYELVSHENLKTALDHSEASLELGARIYNEAKLQRIEYLAGSASVMSADPGIRNVLVKDPVDTKTLSSNLQSFTGRIGAPVIALFDTAGVLLANSQVDMENENRRPFQYLIGQASDAKPETNGFAYLNHELHVLVVVPLYAPYPNIFAWFGLAFPIDQVFARKIHDTTGLEVTFVSTDDPVHPRVLASTLPGPTAGLVAQAVSANLQAKGRTIKTIDLPDDRYVTLFKTEDLLGDDPVTVVLQRPLSFELAAAHELENYILLISLGALGAATLVALSIAHGVSQPVQQLAEYTRHVAAGDYTRRIELWREDELGQLATAFNDMSAGLAERDRVRDLLDKNVSPEVAAQLMRDGAALGGEEREVTVLFADLRGFTPLSETLPPREVLALLNRYLDRMSAEIERHGGVIDKFIGDEIMALFGAPVSHGDDADRALAAALGMEAALAQLNREFAAEGRPPLAIGIGINTARVVAGNMGSHRRLNYSVIGDGVNVAARLQTLTRTPEYQASILVSAATLRAARASHRTRSLGEVTVKGRAEPVTLFALDPNGS
jgi:adenylate cyclase